jgi:tRNA G46 methylase TrmB
MADQGSGNVARARALGADAWADAAELVDLQLSPLGLPAIGALDLRPGNVVLDIGCGAGQTLVQFAERVGPEGRVIGWTLRPSSWRSPDAGRQGSIR